MVRSVVHRHEEAWCDGLLARLPAATAAGLDALLKAVHSDATGDKDNRAPLIALRAGAGHASLQSVGFIANGSARGTVVLAGRKGTLTLSLTGATEQKGPAPLPGTFTFKTVVGDVKFGKGGGWSEARVLQVQYRNIKRADLSEFKDARTQAVVWPSSLASGTVIYPYAKAKRKI